ncbi:MAG: hypothetical protein ABIB46_02440 [bacterium]
MVKIINLFLIIVLSFNLFGCKKKQDLFSFTPDEIKQKINIFLEIEKEKSYKKIENIYKIHFQNIVLKMDEKYQLETNLKIEKANRNCVLNQEVHLNKIVLSKAMQKIFYLWMKESLSNYRQVSNKKKRGEYLKFAQNFYEGFQSQVKEIGLYSENENLFDVKILESFSSLKKYIDSQDQWKEELEIKKIDDISKEIFGLSVCYKIKQLEEIRKKNINIAQTKLTEAVLYYDIIVEEIIKNNPYGYKTICKSFTGDLFKIDAKIIEKEIFLGLKIL